MNKLNLNPTELKILSLAAVDDNRVQTHYSKEVFNCHYLPDIIQHVRKKLELYFKTSSGENVLFTEFQRVVKANGKTARIGIYRINPNFKGQIKKVIATIKLDEAQGRN